MTKALKINKNTDEGVIDFLKYLLDSEKVKGVFILKKIDKNGSVAYSLVTKSDELDDAVPFYPLMPVNAGKLLSRFTLKGKTEEPVIAVLKPCELRSFIELVKREQGSLDNLFFISPICGGVYPTKMEVDGKVEKNISKYWDSVKKGETPNDLRAACRSCTEFTPYNADITVDLAGNTNLEKQTIFYLNNEKSEDLSNGFKAEKITKDLDKKNIESITKIRDAEKRKLFKEIDEKLNGIDGLVEIFGRCIGCHGCSKVCPICYCKLCEFESPDSEYSPANYESELNRRGGLKVPAGTTYYQLGRLTHISISCVGCGSCEDACPVDIPLSLIFKKVGESVQKTFDYVPGKNIEEDVPLVTFKEEELTEIEE